MIRNNFIDFAFEHQFGCHATKSGFAGDIGTIEIGLIDSFIDKQQVLLNPGSRVAYSPFSSLCLNLEGQKNLKVGLKVYYAMFGLLGTL